jgi:uncharacterized protein
MEEILASIRRIIADDEAKPSDRPAAAPAASAAPSKPAMKDIPPSAIPAAKAAAAKAAAPAPAPSPASEMPMPGPILSHSTVSAVESAFNTLAHTVLSNNARTLEDLVKEMLRPMLKSWLDDNLPGLVERIVKAEIERVSRGR